LQLIGNVCPGIYRDRLITAARDRRAGLRTAAAV
jgi:hypothetical protein